MQGTLADRRRLVVLVAFVAMLAMLVVPRPSDAEGAFQASAPPAGSGMVIGDLPPEVRAPKYLRLSPLRRALKALTNGRSRKADLLLHRAVNGESMMYLPLEY